MQAPLALCVPVIGNELTNGSRYASEMPKSGKPKATEKRPPPIAAVIKKNTLKLFEFAARVPEMADRTNPVALEAYIKARAKEFGDTIGKSSIYRMMEGKRAVGADVLDLVARAFDLEAWHLLTPGLDPGNPPDILVSESQKAFWRSVTQAQKRLVELRPRMVAKPSPESLALITIIRAQREAREILREAEAARKAALTKKRRPGHKKSGAGTQ